TAAGVGHPTASLFTVCEFHCWSFRPMRRFRCCHVSTPSVTVGVAGLGGFQFFAALTTCEFFMLGWLTSGLPFVAMSHLDDLAISIFLLVGVGINFRMQS